MTLPSTARQERRPAIPVVCAVCLAAVGLSACGRQEPGEKERTGGAAVVVTVEGARLTRDELDARMQRVCSLRGLTVSSPAERTALETTLTDSFIAEVLFLKEAKRRNIAVDTHEIERIVARSRGGAFPEGLDFASSLRQFGMTEADFRENVRRHLLIDKLITVPEPAPERIRAFYDQNSELLQLPERVELRHILVRCGPTEGDETHESRKAAAEDLRARLLAGSDFAELAKAHSDCPSAQAGGNLGVCPRGVLQHREIEDAAFSQTINEIGPVVRSPVGYHILKVVAHEQPGTMPFEAAKSRIAEELRERKRQARKLAALNDLKKNAKIEYD